MLDSLKRCFATRLPVTKAFDLTGQFMTDEEFGRFIASAMEELQEKQKSMAEAYKLGDWARWWFDQNTEKLDFFDEEGMKRIQASFVDIGSYSSESNTWKWAWANDSLTDSLREKASTLRALGDLTGFEIFDDDVAVEIDGEPMAWELAALGVRHLGALGVYRAPSSDRPLFSFLAITAIEWVRDEI